VAPDIRLDLDITRPVVKIYNPVPDPAQRDTLVLRWEASDRNLDAQPITLEWSEMPDGPWQSVISGGAAVTESNGFSSVPVTDHPSPRLPNNGTHAWRIPSNMPTHRVYLRVTAVDRAGNIAEAKTPQPIEIDMNKPVAKIEGIVSVEPLH
jgi:hypothetical protein